MRVCSSFLPSHYVQQLVRGVVVALMLLGLPVVVVVNKQKVISIIGKMHDHRGISFNLN